MPVSEQHGPPQLRADTRPAFASLDLIEDCGPTRSHEGQVLPVCFARHRLRPMGTFVAIEPRGANADLRVSLVDQS